MIDSYLSAKPNTLTTNYYLTFPNQTTKTFRDMVGGVIYKYPPSSCKIACQTNNQTITQTVAVVAGQNSNVKFQFNPQSGSLIYQDYFEGAFPNSAWTPSRTGSDKVTQTTAHYETASHSLQATIDGTESTAEYAFVTHKTTSGMGTLDLVSSSNVYVKAYVRFSTLPTSGGSWCPINLRATTGSPGALAWLELQKDSTGAYWEFHYRDSTTHTTKAVRISGAIVNANQWYSIEIHTKTDCSAGVVGCWINGKLVLEKTGLNNGEWGPLQYIRLGEIYSTPGSGTHSTYIDDLTVSNSYIP
jgi:hypothetical protein